MRVAFVLPGLGASGGVGVATQHARLMRDALGVDAELVVTEAGEGGVDPGVPVRTLPEAREGRYDVAIGTWWETAAPALGLAAKRHALLLQSFEQRFYGREAPFERLSAEATLALPVDFVVVGEWMRELLAELRPGARCRVVPPGVDKRVFAGARSGRDGPLRVLIEGQPTLPFKGVDEAVAAVRAMREPVRSTLVALDPERGPELAVDRVTGALDPDGMAALYREHDVLLKLSRVEGLGLAPVEGFHSGLPCVVTPYTGHAEYARHGENALVVGFDDQPGTAAALDRLARDGALLERLSEGALATAAGWPSAEDSSRALHEELTRMLEREQAAPDESLLRRTVALGSGLGRAGFDRGRAATAEALDAAERLVRELSASRDDCSEMLEDARAELARIRSSPVYRLGGAAKRAGRRIAGR
ncbi:MAG TPA: glycosyltransferase family 4 protein [Thermoleophilaceae bacterium]